MWERLALPSETNFQVPSTGMVQRMAHSRFSSSRSLSWLDMISRKPGLYYRWFLYGQTCQNVNCIVAALGWPAATTACASSTAVREFVLPPEVVLPQADHQPRARNQRNPGNQQQPWHLRLQLHLLTRKQQGEDDRGTIEINPEEAEEVDNK